MTERRQGSPRRKATKKGPKRRRTSRSSARRARRAAGKVLKQEPKAHGNAKGIPRLRRAKRRHAKVPRRPAPKLTSRLREKPRLKRLSAEHRRAVDSLLVRVYEYAAKELAALEAKQQRETHRVDEETARRYDRARAEVMAAYHAWEEKQRLNH